MPEITKRYYKSTFGIKHVVFNNRYVLMDYDKLHVSLRHNLLNEDRVYLIVNDISCCCYLYRNKVCLKTLDEKEVLTQYDTLDILVNAFKKASIIVTEIKTIGGDYIE